MGAGGGSVANFAHPARAQTIVMAATCTNAMRGVTCPPNVSSFMHAQGYTDGTTGESANLAQTQPTLACDLSYHRCQLSWMGTA